MHTIKFRHVFIILIFLFCFYGTWLAQGKAENVSRAKDWEQVSVNNKETQAFDTEATYHQTVITKEDPITSEIKEEKDDRQELSIGKDHQSNAPEKEIPSATSPIMLSNPFPDEEVSLIEEEKEDQTSVVDKRQQRNAPDDVKTSSLEEEKSLISHQVNTEEKESQDTKEKEISSHLPELFPTTVYEKEALSEFGNEDSESSEETSPVNEDKQEVITDKNMLSDVKEKETLSIISIAVPSTPSSSERESLIKEENGTQSSKVFDERQGIIPDEESISLLQEEKSPIDYQPISNEETYPQEQVREITASETQSPSIEQSGIQLPTLDEKPSPDIVDKIITSSDIEDGKNLRENPFINEDGQNLVTEKEIPSATSPITISNPSTHEEAPLIELEKGDQTSVVDNRQQGNVPGEEKSLISHQVNTDEKESQDIKEKDIPSNPSEHSPTTAHVKKALSGFVNEDSESSEETSPVNEDKQEVITDKNMLSDVKEKEIFSITSIAVPITPSSGERESLIKEENGTQSSKVSDERQGIIPDEESISLLQGGGESPVDYQPIGKEETTPQNIEDEITEREETKFTWKIWHGDPTHSIILAVVITLIAAKIGGWTAGMIRLPSVVGKLILGMILGNFYLFTGSDYFDFLKTMPFLKMISYFGTLILLLTAGLHTDLRALLRVGASSFLVCLGGIAASAGLGIIVSYFLAPDISNGAKVLLAIVLCNTSTGLLFAILNELKVMNTLEGRVIVGAAIISEIIVILTFGITSGIVVKGGVCLPGITVSFGVAFFLLITAVIIIFKYGEKLGNFLSKKLTEGLNMPIIVILSLLLAFMFGSIGLHTVIGAFIAGLFLRNVKLRDSDDGEYRNVESFIRPFYALLVPILFVRVGAMVDLKSFLNLDAMFLGLAITGAAVAGKLFCSVCPIDKGINRLAIGIGMATRLEGTLILAGIGRDIGVFNDTIFSSLIMAIVFTSTICPFLMKILLLKKNSIRYESICIDAGKKLVKVFV